MSKRIVSHVLLGALTSVAGILIADVKAWAQIEEIVVTSRRREENLQNVPIAITAFTAATIERKGITDLSNVAKYTPGLFLDEGSSIQDTRIVIRGLSPTRGRQNVAILQDDVDISSLANGTAGGSFVINPRLTDVERIEVIKGPHSALYGRSAFNGAINYISKVPGDEFVANIQADFATYGKYEGRFAVMGPVTPGRFSVGINGEIWNFDGFYKSPTTGHGLGGGHGEGVAPSFAATPNDWLKANFRMEWSKDNFDPEARTMKNPTLVPLPQVALVPANGLPAVVGAAVAANPANFTYPQTVGSMGTISDWPAPSPSTNPLTGTDFPGHGRTIFRNTLRLEAESSFARFTSITHYGNNKESSYADAFGLGDMASPQVSGSQVGNSDIHIKLVTEEVRIQSNNQSRLSWTLGALFWDELYKQTSAGYQCVYTSGGCAALVRSIGEVVFNRPNERKRNTYHLSGYGAFEFSITDALKISAEVRYTTETEKTSGYAGTTPAMIGCPALTTAGRNIAANGTITCAQAGAPVTGPFLVTLPYVTAAVDSKYWVPRATLDYKVNADMLLYVSVAEGKKPGGFSPLATLATIATNIYDPEELWAYELGAKTDWLDKRLQFNASIYYQDFKKKQVSITFVDPTTTPPNQLATRVVNAGKAHVKGLELEFNAAPTEQVSLNFAYTYNDAKYDTFVDINSGVSAISRAVVNNPNACTVVVILGANRCQLDYSGNQLEGSFKHQVLMGGELRGHLSGDIDWFAGTDMRWTSKRYTSFENSLWMEPYWNVDVRAGVRTNKWTITAYANNLNNDLHMKNSGVYVQNWNIAFLVQQARTPLSVQAPSAGFAILPDKRQFGVRSIYNF